jgi:hypothetical protein
MADGSLRAGRSSAGPLLLAVIFLAILGAGAGFSLGTLARDAHVSSPPTSNQPVQQVGTDPSTPAGNDSPSTQTGTPSDGNPADSRHCPRHTVELAGAGPLSLVLYLRTAQSEVWVCRSGDGTLFYQGHAGQPGQPLYEGSTALFLKTIEREESTGGYVATNTDPSGRVTKYHVTRQRLVKEFIGYSTPKPSQTEDGVS